MSHNGAMVRIVYFLKGAAMVKRFFANITWLITALGAIHLGLVALGYDIFTHSLFATTLHGWVVPIHYVIGIAGIFSLVMYFSAMTCSYCDKSGNCSC